MSGKVFDFVMKCLWVPNFGGIVAESKQTKDQGFGDQDKVEIMQLVIELPPVDESKENCQRELAIIEMQVSIFIPGINNFWRRTFDVRRETWNLASVTSKWPVNSLATCITPRTTAIRPSSSSDTTSSTVKSFSSTVRWPFYTRPGVVSLKCKR